MAKRTACWRGARTWFGDAGRFSSGATGNTGGNTSCARVDDRDFWAHLAQGNLFLRLRRFDDSIRAIRRALELNPNSAFGHAFLAVPLANLGKHREAIESAGKALRLSPADRSVSAQASMGMAAAHFAAEHYPECVTWARNMIEKAPEHIAGHILLTAALAIQGETGGACGSAGSAVSCQAGIFAGLDERQPATKRRIGRRLREGLRKAGVAEA